MEQSEASDPFVIAKEAYFNNDFATALTLWMPLAEQGLPAAQCNIGTIYHFGFGGTEDFIEAHKWYAKAADQGFGPAMHNLGVLYHNGQGVRKSLSRAFMWLKLAADRGVERSIFARDALQKIVTPAELARAEGYIAKFRQRQH